MLKDFSNPSNSLFILCLFPSLRGWVTVVTLARLTSSWLSSHTTSWDILLCGNSWLWDLCVMAHVDVNNYTKKVLQRQYFGGISEHLPWPCPDLSYLIHLFKCNHLYPLNPESFLNIHPLLSSHDRGPPFSPHVTADSHALTPQAIHQLYNIGSLSTPSQNTPLWESLGQNSRRDFLVFTLLHSKPPVAWNVRKPIRGTYFGYLNLSKMIVVLQESLVRYTAVFWRCRGGKK